MPWGSRSRSRRGSSPRPVVSGGLGDARFLGVALEVPGVLSVGVVLPFPGVRGLVVADGELGDLVLQVFLGLEAAAPQELAGQDAETIAR